MIRDRETTARRQLDACFKAVESESRFGAASSRALLVLLTHQRWKDSGIYAANLVLRAAASVLRAVWLHKLLVPRLAYRLALALATTRFGRALLLAATSRLRVQLLINKGRQQPCSQILHTEPSTELQGCWAAVGINLSLLFGLLRCSTLLEFNIHTGFGLSALFPWLAGTSAETPGKASTTRGEVLHDQQQGAFILQPEAREREEFRFVCSKDFEQHVLCFLRAQTQSGTASATRDGTVDSLGGSGEASPTCSAGSPFDSSACSSSACSVSERRTPSSILPAAAKVLQGHVKHPRWTGLLDGPPHSPGLLARSLATETSTPILSPLDS